MILFVYILEMIGTVAFAFSGAMTAIKKELDLFGVLILAVTTAVGGGVIRDILLGETPPQMFLHPSYVVVAAIVSVILFIWIYRHGQLNTTSWIWTERVMRYADTIGLAVFTVVGVKTAFEVSHLDNTFLAVFVGTLTGVGGGLLRDVIVGLKPYIFVKHVYALSSILGAMVCTLFWHNQMGEAGMICGAVTIIVIRLLAMYFEWNLPKVRYDSESRISDSENK